MFVSFHCTLISRLCVRASVLTFVESHSPVIVEFTRFPIRCRAWKIRNTVNFRIPFETFDVRNKSGMKIWNKQMYGRFSLGFASSIIIVDDNEKCIGMEFQQWRRLMYAELRFVIIEITIRDCTARRRDKKGKQSRGNIFLSHAKFSHKMQIPRIHIRPGDSSHSNHVWIFRTRKGVILVSASKCRPEVEFTSYKYIRPCCRY